MNSPGECCSEVSTRTVQYKLLRDRLPQPTLHTIPPYALCLPHTRTQSWSVRVNSYAHVHCASRRGEPSIARTIHWALDTDSGSVRLSACICSSTHYLRDHMEEEDENSFAFLLSHCSEPRATWVERGSTRNIHCAARCSGVQAVCVCTVQCILARDQLALTIDRDPWSYCINWVCDSVYFPLDK